MNLSPAIRVSFSPKIEGYELDCRLLFMGDHLRQLVRTYQEVVYRFRRFQDLDLLYKSLQSSAEITQFYELTRRNGVVAIDLRPSIFAEEGPVEYIDTELTFALGGRSFSCRLPVNRLRALGTLLPALRCGSTESQIQQRLEKLNEEEISWATDLFARLKEGFLEGRDPAANFFENESERPRVSFLGHSSLLFQTKRAAIVTDPCFRWQSGLPDAAFDVTRLKPLAICCSHSHWDHFHLQSLIWFDKDTPIYIPKLIQPTAFNPPMVNALQLLGFTDIREIAIWESLRFEDIDLIAAPFHGEQDEPDARIDHFTYVLKSEGLSVYGGADSYRDTFGDMIPVLQRIREEHKPDVAFLPVSKMIYYYKWGGVNGFCSHLDNTLLDQSFQYTASADDAAHWVEVLKPQIVSPYATFNFAPWSTPREVSLFAKALQARGLGHLLYPVRTLQGVSASELASKSASMALRRKALIQWFHLGAAIKRWDRKLQKLRLYRYAYWRIKALRKRFT
jgi:L-ascorbate metabolism protein UlaG (beta-lactamase superfamily)